MSASCSPLCIRDLSVDLLSTIVAELELHLREPRIHILKGSWSRSLEPGAASVHLMRHGRCSAWPATARHSLPMDKGCALLLSGEVDCAIQAIGPRRAPQETFDCSAGRSLEHPSFPPTGDGVQLVSAQVDLAARPGRLAHRLPPVVVIRPHQLPLPGFRDPVVETLIAETSHPRPGATAVVQRLLEVFIIQGLRAELTDAFWSAPGYLGVLSDPVLRTGLNETDAPSLPLSLETLAAELQRSARRVRSRVKAISGDSPGRLLRQSRMQRAIRRLEHQVPRLADIARELGYANVCSFCRAFQREAGCTPTEYWRSVTGRPFPRPGRPGRGAEPRPPGGRVSSAAGSL
ncbi:MAG: AraC family transcriptional regulator, partial [Myxococcaceae bacterium]